MTPVVCANKKCGKQFQARSARSRFCCPTCQHRDWVDNNKEHVAEYARVWYSKNPEIIEKYNAARRKGWAKTTCANPKCGKEFEKTGGASKYCSVRCRNKVRYANPEYRVKHKKYWKKWYTKNIEHYREKLRQHYHKHAIQKRQIEPWRDLLKGRKRDANKRGILFELTPAWAAKRWTGYCELTGIKFASAEQRTGYKRRNFSPSIDKIIPALGYTEANSRFVLWAINSFKRDGTDEEMYQIANALITRVRKDLSYAPLEHSWNNLMRGD